MKKVVSAFILVLTLACFSVVGVYAAVVEKPVIEAEMPDCYREIGNGSIVLYANATVPNGGTVRYQWYVADTENMAMIHAIFVRRATSIRCLRKLVLNGTAMPHGMYRAEPKAIRYTVD